MDNLLTQKMFFGATEQNVYGATTLEQCFHKIITLLTKIQAKKYH